MAQTVGRCGWAGFHGKSYITIEMGCCLCLFDVHTPILQLKDGETPRWTHIATLQRKTSMHFVVILCDGSTIVGKTYQHLEDISFENLPTETRSSSSLRLNEENLWTSMFFLFVWGVFFTSCFQLYWSLDADWATLTRTYGPNYSIVPRV